MKKIGLGCSILENTAIFKVFFRHCNSGCVLTSTLKSSLFLLQAHSNNKQNNDIWYLDIFVEISEREWSFGQIVLAIF
ncbi:MAG: hypothetical protein AAFV25_15075, partial [Bacteroidota bacterium]